MSSVIINLSKKLIIQVEVSCDTKATGCTIFTYWYVLSGLTLLVLIGPRISGGDNWTIIELPFESLASMSLPHVP